MTTRLFGDTGNWTQQGGDLANRLNDAIRPILKQYIAEGFHLRDIQLIAHIAAMDTALEVIITSTTKTEGIN